MQLERGSTQTAAEQQAARRRLCSAVPKVHTRAVRALRTMIETHEPLELDGGTARIWLEPVPLPALNLLIACRAIKPLDTVLPMRLGPTETGRAIAKNPDLIWAILTAQAAKQAYEVRNGAVYYLAPPVTQRDAGDASQPAQPNPSETRITAPA